MTSRPGHTSRERFAEFLERFRSGYYSRERLNEDSGEDDPDPQEKGEKKQRRRGYLKQ